MTVRVPSEHKSSADHNGGQPGCKWTSQIWNIAHCLGALGRGHCAYTYDISQICRNMMCFHSRIDKLWISPVILMGQLVEKKFYKLLSRSVHSLPWITTFGSLVMRFANNFHSWLRHSWKLLAIRFTRDPKIVIHGNSCIILYIHAGVQRWMKRRRRWRWRGKGENRRNIIDDHFDPVGKVSSEPSTSHPRMTSVIHIYLHILHAPPCGTCIYCIVHAYWHS